MVHRLVIALIRIIANTFFRRIDVVGIENVPEEGPVIFAGNHPNALMDGFKGYTQGKATHEYDYKALRQAIYANHKEEIVKDLNQDLVQEIESLNNQIKQLQQINRY